MPHILVLNSSISGNDSVSRLLVEDALQHLLGANPDAHVTHRDVGVRPPPHLLPETVAGVRAEATTGTEEGALARSNELIAELTRADVILIGSPMYNFSISTGLRAWFDHVLRPRITFAYSEAGVQGLVMGKKVFVIETRGGLYTEGPNVPMDFQEPYLKVLLGFIGLTDVTFIQAERIGYGQEAREAAIAGAKSRIAAAVALPIKAAA